MKHYSELELERYLNSEMPCFSRFFCNRHLQKCPSCRVLLNDLREDRQLATEVRKSVKTLEEVKQEIEKSKISRQDNQE